MRGISYCPPRTTMKPFPWRKSLKRGCADVNRRMEAYKNLPPLCDSAQEGPRRAPQPSHGCCSLEVFPFEGENLPRQIARRYRSLKRACLGHGIDANLVPKCRVPTAQFDYRLHPLT